MPSTFRLKPFLRHKPFIMKVYIVNAFTKELFGGNPAAVISLPQWPADDQMQQMAAQHNLSETAFIVPEGADYSIRWFTPSTEVKLCGHATLASAHVFFNHLGYQKDRICFHSKSGPLIVSRGSNGTFTLDFPANEPVETQSQQGIEEGLKKKPLATFRSSFDYMVLLEKQSDVENLSPDLGKLATVEARGVIATAKGDSVDFVSRCFYPQSGINEDPVTGSAHTIMVPFWSKRLGKTKLSAIQLSKRRGYLDCELAGDRVLMSGHAVTYMEGEIFI